MSEEKRLRAVTKSAAFLQSCFPPNRQAGAARILAKLGGPQPDTALLETLLEGTSYTRLSPVDCPNPSCQRSFLFSECNRDGDAYRCVWCNKLVHGDGSFTPPPATTLLPKGLRALERSFNLAFIDYATAYFGSSALVNCYVSPRNEFDKGMITVTILIRKVVEDATATSSSAAAADENAALNGSIWNSSHTIHLRIDRDYKIDVTSTSTVYIESQSPPCRFSGHVTKPNPKFATAIPESLHEDFEANRSDITAFCSRSPATRQLLVTSVGDLVQRAENRLRDVIGSIYFGKSAQVGTDLRCPIGRTEQGQTRMMSAVTGNDGSRSGAAMNFPSVDATGKQYEVLRAKPQPQQQQAPPPPPPMMMRSQQQEPEEQPRTTTTAAAAATAEVSYWEEDFDEEGNAFYTNIETGETEWELPEGGVIQEKQAKKDKKEKKEKKDKKDKKKKKHEEEDEEENNEQEAAEYCEVAEEGEEGQEDDGEWTISSVLYALELQGDVEEYVAMLSAAEVNTVEDLIQCDKDYLKDTVGISSSSDRKKIVKCINEMYEAQQEE